ncbi:MAG: alpha/beta hydrolase family protein [Gaiellaceae bacterium]
MLRLAAIMACAVVACFIGVGSTPPVASPAPPALQVRVFRFVDHSRTIRLPDGRRVPRTLVTVVRLPAAGGPYPLIVFGHGYALTPATYAGLLRAWAEAGYVVAAPVFPLGNANAPGGPDESDLVNQPRDMSVVITKLLDLNSQANGVLGGRIDPSRIAVAGHSDGAETALAVAYDHRYRDRRIGAAIVLSGAALPGMGAFPQKAPPLLAVQGTADTTNVPANTSAYFGLALRPKFLVWLLGASHLPPYTEQQPQLGIVEHATTAFLDHYLKDRPLRALVEAARRPGLTQLTADP